MSPVEKATKEDEVRNVIGSEFDLRRIYEPTSIAVIGASSRPGTLSWWPLRHLVTRDFEGQLLPVNPGHDELQGVPCLSTVDELPEDVDLAMIALNAEAAGAAARACADRGVGAVVLPAQGMGERSPAAKQAELDMVAYCNERGTRVIGPNADGVGNLANGALASIQPLFAQGIQSGRLAVVTQSGATAGSLLNRLRLEGIGCRLYASTGNEADLGLEDHLSYMLQDPGVDMVLSFVESVRRPDDFHAVAELAAEVGKPIGLIKVGRSEQGARRAAAHTGALTGQDAIYDALFASAGIIRVGELSELVALAKLYLANGVPRSPGVGIMSVSGGQAGAVADAAAAEGCPVPELEPVIAERLDPELEFGAAFNPCDLTGEVARDTTLAATVYDGFSQQADIGTVIYARKILTGTASTGAAENLAKVAVDGNRAALVVYAMDGEVPDEEGAHYDGADIPVFTSLHDLMVAHRGLAEHGRRRADRSRRSLRRTTPVSWDGPRRGVLDEVTSRAAVEAYGLRGPASEFARNADAAADAVARVGLPAVVKVVSHDILHKSEVGGVVLDLRTHDDVRAAAEAVLDNARVHAPDADVAGVLVSGQVQGGVEALLGVTVDPSFGPFVVVGLGGVFAEALEDVVLRPAPVDLSEAQEMIDALRGRKVFDGFRGAPPADVEALADAVVRLSEFAADHADVLVEVDLNPVLVLPSGQGVRLVDALVVCSEDP